MTEEVKEHNETVNVEQPKAEPYAAVPKTMMDGIVNYLGTRPWNEVHHAMVPIVYGNVIQQVSIVPTKEK
jgi:hypothetical protein